MITAAVAGAAAFLWVSAVVATVKAVFLVRDLEVVVLVEGEPRDDWFVH